MPFGRTTAAAGFQVTAMPTAPTLVSEGHGILQLWGIARRVGASRVNPRNARLAVAKAYAGTGKKNIAP